MKALVVDAKWRPREGYPLTEGENIKKRALCGNQVWRNPRFEIKEVPTPNINDDEVLIRVKTCGICGSDTHLYETDKEGYIIFSGLVALPCILGHEFSGIIEKVGEKVRSLKPGDAVAVESILWCGICTPCRSGALNQCRNIDLAGLSSDGAFAEFTAVKEKYCWKLNGLREIYKEKEIFEVGALIEPAGCAYNGMFANEGRLMPGNTFVVYGVGPIGLAAVALAKIAGASKIIAFDKINERLELAKSMGADFVFDFDRLHSEDSRPSDKVLELTDGEGSDMQIEAAGAAPETIPEMEKAMAPNGKIIYLGRAATSTPMVLDALVSGANKIIGARGHAGYGIFPNIIKLLTSSRLDLRKMITARYPFDEVIDAINVSSERTDGKIMIRI
ncbi:MAG: alcohol dehydrogenase catalytic domain-containing protein [Deltaproteobacteria bacterium]|nr:alcohol dehydrogenase catalytic domain-containing protein [Deltaproteobacteria bacterium]